MYIGPFFWNWNVSKRLCGIKKEKKKKQNVRRVVEGDSRRVTFYDGKFTSSVNFFSHWLTENFTLQIMTPFLTAKLAGKYVAVDAAGLLMSTLQVRFPSLTTVQTGMTVYTFFSIKLVELIKLYAIFWKYSVIWFSKKRIIVNKII